MADAALKFFARLRQGVEQEIDRWPWVVFALVPALRALFEDFIVTFLVLFDKPFEADVAAHFQSAMVTGKQEQQTRSASVAVAEGVDAEEIEIQRGGKDERMNPFS